MTEAWMLADKELLKKQLCTDKSDSELEIDKHPESFSNPKETIKKAINKAREGITKRHRKKLTIDDLYSPLGTTIELSKLESLSSYKKFEKAVRDIFPQL
jgi:DNA replication protein DnaD